jgi:serine/threonine protein kinase
MGSCLSGFAPQHLIDMVDGNEEDYQRRFLEENEILGEGEFGIVKLVHDMQLKKKLYMKDTTAMDHKTNEAIEESKPFACKILQKGIVFKDNVLYTPLKPEVLRGEIEMLRTLAGNHYCLKLHAVYESTKRLYVITECCTGGTMSQYVAVQGSDFTTDDVSRIAYQLLSAIDHCSKHRILHRDIKPDNIMFINPKPGADVRLIDFGSGCIDPKPESDSNGLTTQYVNGLRVHQTFAGSAFYTSPELFNRSYTSMTDVWSIGVTLYVLVAGYPADALQAAFNILQRDQRDLHKLPNMPTDIHESFYELLNGCLTYWYKQRPTAKTLLQYEFVTLHQKDDFDEMDVGLDITNTIDDSQNVNWFRTKRRTQSISLVGSVIRHNLFLDFLQYERSITTLLATLLSKSELEQLYYLLTVNARLKAEETLESETDKENVKEQQLSVVPITDLKSILRDDLHKTEMYVQKFVVLVQYRLKDSVC